MIYEQQTNISELRHLAKAEVGKVIVGQGRATELMLVAAIAHGHVLLEGPPGSAKTMLANAVARVLGVNFKRLQFTPDTTPAEITGQMGKNLLGEAVFMPGVVFTNVLLADELNRTPPKTQAALLEAMQERFVTVEGKRHPLPDPFLVIATQNPFEHDGVYPLAESQLDRFLFKIGIDYCDEESELDMLRLPHSGVTPDVIGEISPLLGPVGLDKARMEMDSTEVSDDVARGIIRVVRSTRDMDGVELGASSRAAIHLQSAAKACARLEGRPYVTPDDVREMSPYVLRHRLILDGRRSRDDVLAEALSHLPGSPAAV